MSEPVIPEGLTSMEVEKPISQVKQVRQYIKKNKAEKHEVK
jgi:hypothetical protein